MTKNGLDIRLLGIPRITIGDEPIDVDTRKAIALLAYLSVEKAAARGELATLFWAESPTDRARASLRRTLSSLRSGAGSEVVLTDGERIELTGSMTCDVDEFTGHVEATRAHGHDDSDVCPRCIPRLTHADSLYRGDFLEGFSIRGAPYFEDWVRAVTESMRLREGDVLNRLAIAHASKGDYTAAVETVGRWIELDGLHEPAHRLLMLLHAWAGDRPGAIRAYRECVAILDRELGVPPLNETTELYEAILDEDLPPAPGPRQRMSHHPRQRSEGLEEMLDRGDAIAALVGALDAVDEGGQVVMISGEPWMGKTRLIQETATLAHDRGAHVLEASAYRAEQMLPYAVAIQLLGSTAVDEISDGLPEWMLLELARLDPELAPGMSAPRMDRFGQVRFFEAVHGLLVRMATLRPLVVTIDDAQWVDSASAALIAYVVRRVADIPIVMVVSALSGATLDPALAEATADADERIALDPLQGADVQGLGDAARLDDVIEATGGIPLLVGEALRSDTDLVGSSSVARYLESHLRAISDLSHQVLVAASVLGGMCELDLLRETSGRAEDEVVGAVEELMRARLLTEQGDGRLGFTLDALEALVYEQTSLIRRRLLHGRAASALRARPRAETEARLVTAIASHLRRAGSEDAAAWYRLAGDLAKDVYANLEAEQLYESAIALGIQNIGDVRLALGELAMARGDYDRAMRELFSAASHSEGAALALVEHRIGDLHRILGRFDLADESFARAEAEHPDPAALFADWALLRHRTGRHEDAMSLAMRARTESKTSNDPGLAARSLNILGVVTPDRSLAMAHFDEALQLAAEHDPARMAALNNKARLLSQEGDLEAAMGLVRDAIAIAENVGLRHHEAALLSHLGDLAHRAGRREESERMSTDAVTIFAEIDAGDWEPEIWLLRQW